MSILHVNTFYTSKATKSDQTGGKSYSDKQMSYQEASARHLLSALKNANFRRGSDRPGGDSS